MEQNTLEAVIQHVKDFHDSFKIVSYETPTSDSNKTEFQLRYDLMKEENEEYLEAAKNENLVELRMHLVTSFTFFVEQFSSMVCSTRFWESLKKFKNQT